MAKHWVSVTCEGERCAACKAPATHKVGEEIPSDAQPWAEDGMDFYRLAHRHNLTAYVCCEHFVRLMGPFAARLCFEE